MINHLEVSNINQAFYEAWWIMRANGVTEQSRNGPVLVAPGPFITEYRNPQQRVLFNPKRDANHIFHLVESIWMFAGRNDVEPLLPFNSKYGQYAEPDGYVHGAYGHRWRFAFGSDQILDIIATLQKDPNSRQAVMQMWDSNLDLKGNWKDRPCNTHIYFDLRGGQLNMTVCCRSNDMLWGAYGANVVHFSMLQEVIAWGVRAPMGYYRQFSNNFHLYKENPMAKEFLENPPQETFDLYAREEVFSVPMFQAGETVETFLTACEAFIDERPVFGNEFLDKVAGPLADAYIYRKRGEDFKDALAVVDDDVDWKVGFKQWMENRDGSK